MIKHICVNFKINGAVVSAVPYGNGHINDTYYVHTDKDSKYIFQKINKNVFKDPVSLMDNFALVTEHLAAKIRERGGDVMRETLNIVKTLDDKNFYLTEGGEYWRALVFVENSVSYDLVESPGQFYDCAVAFGGFQSTLRDFPAEKLCETIPNFHNTADRYNNLMIAVSEDKCDRCKDVRPEIAFAVARADFAKKFETARALGKLPLKVTHNDTKLNNILFDKDTGKTLCIIDLDTIMPGYAINDFGDSIRFGATTALEDETDLDKVNFNIDLYEIYVKGFIEGADGGLTQNELDLLADAAIMMTLECGMRFLTDYLSGDTYFKIARPTHNLDRARNQFKLVSDMESKIDEMRAIVKKYSQK